MPIVKCILINQQRIIIKFFITKQRVSLRRSRNRDEFQRIRTCNKVSTTKSDRTSHIHPRSTLFFIQLDIRSCFSLELTVRNLNLTCLSNSRACVVFQNNPLISRHVLNILLISIYSCPTDRAVLINRRSQVLTLTVLNEINIISDRSLHRLIRSATTDT